MDGTNADGGKTARAAQPTGSDANEVARRTPPLSDGAAAAPPDAPGADGNGGAGVEEEVDDEQVDRFYALLANIRAMRRVYTPGAGDDTADGGGGVAATRKRLRSADPPWRPAFRMEDFADAAATATSSRRATTTETNQLPADDGEKAAGVALPSTSQPPRAGARRDDSDSNSI